MFQLLMSNFAQEISLGLDLIAMGATMIIILKLLVSGEDLEITIPDFRAVDLNISARLRGLSHGFAAVVKRATVNQSLNVRG